MPSPRASRLASEIILPSFAHAPVKLAVVLGSTQITTFAYVAETYAFREILAGTSFSYVSLREMDDVVPPSGQRDKKIAECTAMHKAVWAMIDIDSVVVATLQGVPLVARTAYRFPHKAEKPKMIRRQNKLTCRAIAVALSSSPCP